MAPVSAGETHPASEGDLRRWPYWSVVAVLVIGVAVTAILTTVSWTAYRNNEKHLLELRAHEASTALTEALPSIQTPLASAAALADATHGSRAKFMQFAGAYVGTGQQFISISLWEVKTAQSGPVAVVGAPPVLARLPAQIPGFIDKAVAAPKLSMIGPLEGVPPRLGFAFTGPNTKGPFVAYAESPLPKSRYSAPRTGQAYSDLDFAIYVGKSTSRAALLTTSAPRLPLPGRTATIVVPFGDQPLTLQVSARRPLGGSLPQHLPRAIALVGLLLTLGAAGLGFRLTERRRHA